MYALLLTLHVLVCIGLIIAVLLQAGKGADIGAVFGGAGSQALFGSSGPVDFLNKATRVMVVVFMLTSFTLGFLVLHRPTKSIMSSIPAPAGKTMPMPAGPGGSKAPGAMPAMPGGAKAPAPAMPFAPAPQPTAPVPPAK